MNKILMFCTALVFAFCSGCFKYDPLEQGELDWKGLWENEVMTLEVYENGWVIMTRNDKWTDKVYEGGMKIKPNSFTIDRRGLLISITCSIQDFPTSEISNGELIEFITIDNQKLIKSK